MGMSFAYGPPKPEADMVKLIHHAVAAGVTLLDTSDFYGPHTNELLLAGQGAAGRRGQGEGAAGHQVRRLVRRRPDGGPRTTPIRGRLKNLSRAAAPAALPRGSYK